MSWEDSDDPRKQQAKEYPITGLIVKMTDLKVRYLEVNGDTFKVKVIEELRQIGQAGIKASHIEAPETLVALVRNAEQVPASFGKSGVVMFVKYKTRESDYFMVPITELIPGELISRKRFPSSPLTVLDDKVLEKMGERNLETVTRVKSVIVARLSELSVFGYWDLLSPLTPVVRDASSWFFWKKDSPAPQFVTSRTTDKEELSKRGEIILAALKNAKTEDRLKEDAKFIIVWILRKMDSWSEAGLQRVCGFFNQIGGSWQKHHDLRAFDYILKEYGWPVDSSLPPDGKMGLWLASIQSRNSRNGFSHPKLYKTSVNLKTLKKRILRQARSSLTPQQYEELTKLGLDTSYNPGTSTPPGNSKLEMIDEEAPSEPGEEKEPGENASEDEGPQVNYNDDPKAEDAWRKAESEAEKSRQARLKYERRKETFYKKTHEFQTQFTKTKKSLVDKYVRPFITTAKQSYNSFVKGKP
ncbi:hypothetical protein [Nigrospora oryzae fusarivirus 1]|uniref:Uncharacterized protein n=1 Tax=Nigrospora oryzae fusarivirus 1 TaxID=1913649 RepID=A0A1I9UVP0_9VIRU|nr:hypothetical protein [Nigrospora oryzae fusarivirus 1]APA05126.1 hypothetical protein [Nigrospora oryzae fusarivirus 1]